MTLEEVKEKLLSRRGKEFEIELRFQVQLANSNLRGTSPTPWEVVMEAVIILEERSRSNDGG